MLRVIFSLAILWVIAVYVLTPFWKFIVHVFRAEKDRFKRQLTVKTQTKTNNMEDDLDEF